MEAIEKEDLQGIIIRGYASLTDARFLLLKFKSVAQVNVWLSQQLSIITTGHQKPTETATNIAFTYEGLQALGLDEDAMNTFAIEFSDGMASPHRQMLLGDYGTSSPQNWRWGGPGNDIVHVMLLLYADNLEHLNAHHTSVINSWPEDAFEIIQVLDTTEIIERKEHFGFRDGIAQPTINGLDRKDTADNTVATGEFVLGYKNEYDQLTDCPTVKASEDKYNLLPSMQNDMGLKNFGKNGSFIVMRQLEQDVKGFWSYMESKTLKEDGTCDVQQMIRLASKFLGRWPGGAPLTVCPMHDDPAYEEFNDFKFIADDKDGMKCPVGAHIRRSNPRDSINEGDPTSIKVSNKHRILRRGRSYGAPLALSMKPEDIIKAKDSGGERGLYFICLNADIGRQFEFVQNFWINNPKFEGLYQDRDPLTGNHSNPQETSNTGTFRIPEASLRKRFDDIPQFITVKGGAYFFLPGMKALKYLSSL
jgi:Dyp-type peroxidase family